MQWFFKAMLGNGKQQHHHQHEQQQSNTCTNNNNTNTNSNNKATSHSMPLHPWWIFQRPEQCPERCPEQCQVVWSEVKSKAPTEEEAPRCLVLAAEDSEVHRCEFLGWKPLERPHNPGKLDLNQVSPKTGFYSLMLYFFVLEYIHDKLFGC
jgi:hypothetical protein